MIKKIDKEIFDKLLKEDKETALEMLKEGGNYLEEVQIGEQKYKIFTEVSDDLFNQKISYRLPEYKNKNEQKYYAAFIVCKVEWMGKEIYRMDFRYWYFTDNVNFALCQFKDSAGFLNSTFIGKAFFGGAEFTTEAAFTGALFLDKVHFSNAKFPDYTYFGMNDCNWGTNFVDEADFSSAEFTGIANFNSAVFDNKLFFENTIFKERCDLRVKEFGTFVDFRGAEFRGAVFIDWTKLCEYKRRYKYSLSKMWMPRKVIIYDDNTEKEDIEESKKNLLAVKQMLNKIPDYDSEILFYYWYKVYERMCKPKPYIYRPLDWLVLDKLTGYLTRPKRVFWAIVATIFFFCFLYCLPFCSINGPNKTFLWKDITISLQSMNNVWLFFEHFLKSLYFSAITFATIGYGDYQPVGFWTMLFAAFEGLLGVFLISTFLVTLTKKVLW